ncbi:MAG: hypothetical protein WC081_05745 [Candidatus Ratteibacteria bacterium]|jgi:hypothetical protein
MKPIQAVVVVFAVLVAYLVFFLGIRPAKLNRINRRNLFLSTFFLFLVFLSFGRISYAQEDKPTVSGQSKDTRLVSAQRIAALNSTPEWRNLKAFWKKLDQIETKKPEPDKYGVYSGSISPDECSSLRKESDEVFSGLNKITGEKIAAAETGLLKKICNARIDYIGRGTFYLALTRMAIPTDSVIMAKPDFLADLELKIDRLLVLKKAKVINASEYRQALSNIQQDIKAFCILDVFSGQPGSYRIPFPRPSTAQEVDKLASVFNKDFADYQASQKEIGYPELPEKEYLATKKAFADFKESFSGMNELIADLESAIWRIYFGASR